MSWEPCVIVGDTHSPYHSKAAWASFLEFVKDHIGNGDGTIVLNGDMADCVTASSHPKFKRLTPDGIVYEIEIFKEEIIRPLRAAAPKASIVYNQGNHENRWERVIECQAPILSGLRCLDFEEVFGLKESGFLYNRGRGSSGNGIFQLTPLLTVMHGEFSGENAIKKTMMRWMGAVVISHGHQENSKRMSGESGADWVGLQTGCLCEHPNWRSLTAWNRGFLAGHIEKGGHGRYQLDHMRYSTSDWSELYTPWGMYAATCRHEQGKPDSWFSRRVESFGFRGVSNAGGKNGSAVTKKAINLSQKRIKGKA